ncbi:PGPGW domain-containing protein [bacterium]|nr:PGPGW domain-containing protein [bacterium]
MFNQLKQNWHKFKKSRPGNRFQDRYDRCSKQRGPSFRIEKLLRIFTGLVVMFIGAALWFLPGPGWAIVFVGAAIVSGESLWMAKFLDSAEVKIRKWLYKST